MMFLTLCSLKGLPGTIIGTPVVIRLFFIRFLMHDCLIVAFRVPLLLFYLLLVVVFIAIFWIILEFWTVVFIFNFFTLCYLVSYLNFFWVWVALGGLGFGCFLRLVMNVAWSRVRSRIWWVSRSRLLHDVL